MAVTAIYARVSTDEQAEHGTSLEDQVRRCRERAGADAEVMEFVDEGITGKVLQRPKLQDLLLRARQHDIAQVICLDPDRLARNLLHQLLIVDELRASGVEVEFLQFDADTTTPDGKLLFNVRGAISEFEAAQIKRRLYGGKMARAREGRVAAGTCIYGYRLNRLDKRWEEEPREAQTVRLMFEWAVDSWTWEIARRLNSDGIPARFGGQWSQSSVIGILRNDTYVGKMSQMGGVGHVPVPPLVTEAQFDRVLRAIRSRYNRPPGRAVHPYLLTGRLACGVCGRSMCGGYGRPTKSGTTTYYGCTGKTRPSDTGERCTNHYWRSDRLDSQVWGHVLAWLHDPAAFREAAATQAQDPGLLSDLQAEQDRIGREAERLKTERDRVIRAFRRGLISEEDLAHQQKELEGEARVLEQRGQSVEGQMRAAALRAEDVQRAQEAISRIVADVPALEDVEARRAVLGALGVRVVVGPGEDVRIRIGVGE